MLTTTNHEERIILTKFLRNWRNPINRLTPLVSVDMAWTILLNEIGKPRKPVDPVTYEYYRNLYSQQILSLFRYRSRFA